MKKFGIKYHPAVKSEDLPRIDPDNRARIKRAVEERIMTAPHEYAIPLRKTLKGYWKLRVGDYRVVFKVTNETVSIFCISHRKEVYRTVEKRG